jgi:heat shock protein HtpX
MSNLLRTLALLGVAALPAALLGRWLGGWMPGAALALLAAVAACRYCAPVVLRLYRAREVDARDAPHLLAMVRELAQRAELPVPRVYLLDESAPNAFVTGCHARRACLVLTSGILHLLDERELRAVLAHEFAHVLRGDMLPASLAAAAGGVLAAAAQAGLAQVSEETASGWPWAAPLWLLLAPLVALLVHMGGSARKELAADCLGARLCEDPEAMARALRQLRRRADAPGVFALAARYPAGAQMMFDEPLGGRGMLRLFRTHPPRRARLRALRDLARAARGAKAPATASATAALEQTLER